MAWFFDLDSFEVAIGEFSDGFEGDNESLDCLANTVDIFNYLRRSESLGIFYEAA